MPGEGLPSGPPGDDAWLALADEVWDRVAAHLRHVLRRLPDQALDATAKRLIAAPATRLRAGRTRRDAARLLAAGGPVWVDLRARLTADEDLAREVAASLDADGRPAPSPGEPDPDTKRSRNQLAEMRERLRKARADRDEAVRRADGESSRADREAAARREAETRLAEAEAQADQLRDELTGSGAALDAAVERERRRQESELARLAAELRDARREVDRLQRALRDAQRPAPPAASARPRVPAAGSPGPGEPQDPDRVRPGRPSRMPAGLRLDTTEGVRELLAPGRTVLVDGYNVTRQHQGSLPLDRQRRWLVDLLAAARARLDIDVTVVFDGHQTVGTGSSVRTRGVMVVVTASGQTADDDLTFQVAAAPPQEPLVVVTDDAELRGRLASHGVDLLHTGPFVRALA